MQVKSVPTIIVVHASRGYDRQASAKRGIERTLERCMPAMVLELEDPRRPSYLSLPPFSKFPVSEEGDLLSNDFHLIKGSWLNTNTFIFCGGAVNRCLIRSFITILLFKIYTPNSIFSAINNGPDFDAPDYLKKFFTHLTRRSVAAPLHFHFNCEGTYPAPEDFKCFSQDPSTVFWSPNIIWHMMAAMLERHREVLSVSEPNLSEYVNGENIHGNSDTCDGEINLYYWTETESLARFIRSRRE